MIKYDRDPILATLSTLLGSISVILFFLLGFFTFIPSILGLCLGIIELQLSKRGGFIDNIKKARAGIIINSIVVFILLILLILMMFI